MSPVGSHKPNTAVPQAFYAKEKGVTGFTTETGVGQWGTAHAMACKFFDLECHVYMVKVSYQQKPYRRIIMQNYGASINPSPSEKTQFGQKVLADDHDCPGSLGMSISESVEAAATSGGKYKYSLGSFLGPVLMHQTVVGLEAIKQFEMAGEYPDVVIGCIGGGSNFSGFVFPFLYQKFSNGNDIRVVAAEPMSLPYADQGFVYLRLCRYGRDGANCKDAHARPYFHPARHPRWRPALPWHVAAHLRPVRQRRY